MHIKPVHKKQSPFGDCFLVDPRGISLARAWIGLALVGTFRFPQNPPPHVGGASPPTTPSVRIPLCQKQYMTPTKWESCIGGPSGIRTPDLLFAKQAL